jgi:hypothetical protein
LSFSIKLHKKDLEILKRIQEFFCGVGKIHILQTEDAAVFQVNSLIDIVAQIIPHFVAYPLITQKQADFVL